MTRNGLARKPFDQFRNRTLSPLEGLFGIPYWYSLTEEERAGVSLTGNLRVKGPREEEGNIVVEFLIPGVDPEKVSMSIQGKVVKVKTPIGDGYVTLGERIDPERATASTKWGVLTVKIPTRDSKVTDVKIENLN
jgi:HSP20 family molecular chaperone IbpA